MLNKIIFILLFVPLMVFAKNHHRNDYSLFLNWERGAPNDWVDRSVHKTAISIYGSISNYTPSEPWISGGMRFGGRPSQIVKGQCPQIQGFTHLTMCFWLWIVDTNEYQFYSFDNTGNTGAQFFNCYIQSGHFWSYMNGNANYLDSGNWLSTGQWDHIAISIGPSGRRIYINGVYRASDGTTISTSHPDPYCLIGGVDINSDLKLFNGNFKYIKYFNRILSDTEIYKLWMKEKYIKQYDMPRTVL